MVSKGSDLKKPLVCKYLKEIIHILTNLERLREQTSHNELIDEKQKLYKDKLNQLIEVIRDDSWWNKRISEKVWFTI